MTEDTFRLRYVGARFQNARLPVDVLSDLPAFRDLLVAFAKDEWRNLNSKRQRVPKGFDKSLTFDLVNISDGSAIPALNWNREAAQHLLPGFTDELQLIVHSSYDDITRLIDDAGMEKYPKSLASEHIRALNRLGTGLRDNERIEFLGTKGNDGNVVYLDTTRRKRLITRVRETYQTRFESVGSLISNSVEGFVVVRTDEHGNIQIPVDTDQIVEEFDGSLESDVQFDLQVELDNEDRLRRVVSVYDIALIDAQIGAELVKRRNRLAELRTFESGWNDGAGEPISSSALTMAERFLSKRPSLCAAYKIFPTENGGVLFEFENRDWDFSIEFAADGTIEMYGLRLDQADVMEPHHFSQEDEFMKEFDLRVGRQ
ncbi:MULTISPECIES: hypothetical protein [unclassified Bradyrhizobium]|uniref:hypothetical protein n=1 Tax=unclassified Bradyrhizobium TaxID=2631580 RepID=UPI00211E14A0|nr:MULTISPECIES: hypothetical protein [unclassified Bradyrhizobium]